MNFENLIEPPFNYTGSKFKLLPQLIPLFDRQQGRFVDLFSGGGSVYSNVVQFYPKIVVNDIIGDLVRIQRLIILDVESSIAKVRSLVVNKEDQSGYNELRNSYNSDPTPAKLWALILCCTNNMMRFNQSLKFNQTFGRRTFNERTEKKARQFAMSLAPYLERITFLSEDFSNVPITSQDMVYMDPPYSNTEAGYNAYWKINDDLRLFDYCQKIHNLGGKFAVSGTLHHGGEPCRLIQKLRDFGFNVISISCDYNKVSRKGNKETQEVLVVNYEPARTPVEDAIFGRESIFAV